MLTPVPRTVYNQKGRFLLVGSETTTTYSYLNTNFHLKVNRNFLNSRLFL